MSGKRMPTQVGMTAVAAVANEGNAAAADAAAAEAAAAEAAAAAAAGTEENAAEAELTGTIEARILCDHLHFKAGELALLTEAEAISAESGGWADLHEDAVAYAKANAA